MIRRLVDLSLRQPLLIALGLVLFIGAGLIAFKNLPVEAFPDVTDTQVTIITLFPGRAAEEVERQVTMPIEVAMSGLPGALRVFSHTQFGLSYLVITFDDDVNVYFARQQVGERLRTAELPDGVKPELAALTSAISEIFRYRLASSTLDSRQLRELQNWVMERQLKTVRGVADVVSFGGLTKTYEVQPDLARLRDYKISLQQLFDALGKSNANAGGGYVEHGGQQYLIRGIGLLRSAADIENVVIAERNGTPLLIKDVAHVSVGAVPRQGVMGQSDNETHQSDDDIVSGMVLMRKGENPSLVLAALKTKLTDIAHTQLPAGVEIRPFYDRSWLIDRTLHTVFINLLEGAALVFAVLVLFLSNLRAAMIVALVIPLSLLGTFLGLSWVGIPANLLSLGAMDFGIIVDGAVIVVEHIFHRLSRSPPGETELERREGILEAAAAVGRPTLFSMLIIIAAHIPIFTLQRHEGRIFSPMAYSVVAALVASLLLSLTVVPLLAHRFLRGPIPHEDNRLVRAAKRFYEPLLRQALARPKLVFAVAAALLAATVAVAPQLGSEFLPELNEGAVWVNISLEPSVSITEAQTQAHRVRELLTRTPEVRRVMTKLGRPEDGTDPKIASQIESLVDLYPPDQWQRKIDKAQVLAELDAALGTIPGVQYTFSQPIRDNVLESISQIDGQIVIKIIGDDLDRLREYGDIAVHEVRAVRGVSRAFIDRRGQLPQYRIDIDRARAARYGLTMGDIDAAIETALAGREATYIWEGERRHAVTVRLKEADRELNRISQLPITTASGVFIPLSELASFRATSGAMNIARENGRRVLSIGVFIHDRDMGSTVTDMKQAVDAKLKLADGYQVSWSGEFENQERAMARLSWVVPLSILLIYLLLFDAFKSLRNATVIIANIPFALVGGIFALLITGIPLSVSAAIGFIALFGQAVLNGVVMLSYFGQLRDGGLSLDEAVVRGSLDRLRTVLMTALLAMLGLAPMAVSSAIGSETQRPLAIVVIGGLVSATLLTLLVLPTLYYSVHRRDRLKPHLADHAIVDPR